MLLEGKSQSCGVSEFIVAKTRITLLAFFFLLLSQLWHLSQSTFAKIPILKKLGIFAEFPDILPILQTRMERDDVHTQNHVEGRQGHLEGIWKIAACTDIKTVPPPRSKPERSYVPTLASVMTKEREKQSPAVNPLTVVDYTF